MSDRNGNSRDRKRFDPLRLIDILCTHAAIVISGMLIVFFVIDRVNKHMAFMTNEFHKRITFALALLAIYLAVRLISGRMGRPSRAPRKRVHPMVIVLTDALLIGACLLVFALFDHVLPRGARISVTAAERTSPIVQVGSPDGDFSEKFADKFTSGEVIATENSYQSANLNVTLTKVSTKYQEKKKAIDLCYYVEDIYVRKIDYLRTVLAEDTYGRGVREGVLSMADRVNAVAAVNTDFYSFRDEGLVIRNGVLYRDSFAPDEQMLILYRDGTMKGYASASELDLDKAMADGAWQGFSFGPSLLDEYGEISTNLGEAHINHHPRTLFGMVEPGHYLFITVDGRAEGYSDGLTMKGCADICHQLGCTVAYNMDGGETAQMVYMGKIANKPYRDGRDTSDILYVAELPEASDATEAEAPADE